jgi:hypothetical protein
MFYYLPLLLHWTTMYFLIFSTWNEFQLSTNNVLYVEKDRSISTEVSGVYLKNNNSFAFKSSDKLFIEVISPFNIFEIIFYVL